MSIEQMVRRALEAEADAVTPAPDVEISSGGASGAAVAV